MKKRLFIVTLIFMLLFSVACNNKQPGQDVNGGQGIIQDDNVENEDITGTPEDNFDNDLDEDGTDQPADDVFNDETQDEPEDTEDPNEQFSHLYTIEEMDAIMYAKKDVNIRKFPTTDGEVVGRLLLNETIHVVGVCIENGWYKVELEDDYAYIHYDYLVNAKVTVSDSKYAWVAGLKAASKTNQLIIVAATGNEAEVGMYVKDSNGIWTEVFYTMDGRIGRNGLGKQEEGDGKTPIGEFKFIKAFGTKENPGTRLTYTVVNESHYWVDDPNSAYYNQFVSTENVVKDWESAEHLTDYGEWYYYCLALNYNEAREPGKGSAIFLHCTWTGATSGCIAIPEQYMVEVLKNVNENCIIIIDTPTGVRTH